MTRIQEHVVTRLGRQAAFAYVADFANQAGWDPNTVSARRVDDGPLRVGTRFALEVRMGPRVTPMEYRITELVAGERVVLVGEGRRIWTEDAIDFRDEAGATVVDYAAEIRLAGLMGLVQPLLGRAFASVGRAAAAGMRRELDRLAAGPDQV